MVINKSGDPYRKSGIKKATREQTLVFYFIIKCYIIVFKGKGITVIRNFKIVKVDSKYCNYLRKYDSRVSYNAGIKDLRPFIGILFMVDKIEYFAPLSSPKAKHLTLTNTMDLIKIDDGKFGVVNFNNMIPVTKNNYELFDLTTKPNTRPELQRQNLLKIQLKWLNNNIRSVKGKAIRLYKLYNKNILPERIKNRCCNWTLLEEKCREYNKK